MNNRERFLIGVLAAVVILLGGFKLLIQPEIQAYASVRTAYNDASAKQQDLDNNIRRKDTIYSDNAALEKTAASTVEEFFPPLQNVDIQQFFNTIGGQVGINYLAFSMTDPVASAISNPSLQNSELTYPLKDRADEIHSINQSTSSEGTSSAVSSDAVEMMTVSIQFDDSYNKTMAFIDAVKNSQKTVRVTTCDMTKKEDGSYSVNITCECFGISKVADGTNG